MTADSPNIDLDRAPSRGAEVPQAELPQGITKITQAVETAIGMLGNAFQSALSFGEAAAQQEPAQNPAQGLIDYAQHLQTMVSDGCGIKMSGADLESLMAAVGTLSQFDAQPACTADLGAFSAPLVAQAQQQQPMANTLGA